MLGDKKSAVGASARLAKIAACTLVFGLLGTACTQVPQLAKAEDPSVTVLKVVDGETIVADVTGVQTTIRLSNVDAPAGKAKNQAAECLGTQAAAFTKTQLTKGDTIELEYDVKRINPIGETMAGVYKDGALINAKIAAAGFGVAVSFQPNDRFYNEVLAAEKSAQKAKRGLFGTKETCTVGSRVADAVKGLKALDDTIPAKTAEVNKALKTVSSAIGSAKKKTAEIRGLESTGDIVTRAVWEARKSTDEPILSSAMNRATKIQDKLTSKKEAIVRAVKEAEAKKQAAAEAKKQAEAKAKVEAEKKAAKAEAEKKLDLKKKAEAKKKAAEAKKKAEEAKKKAEQKRKKQNKG